ncbi:hypothetical protein Q9189_002750 [Teloschistes chrysophthalmus]
MEKLTEDVEFGLTRVRSAPRAASDNAAIGIQKERRPARIEPGNLRLEIIEDSDNVEWYHKGDGNITKERVKKNQQWKKAKSNVISSYVLQRLQFRFKI